MARASRELAVTHLAQHAAQRLLGDGDAEFLENPLAEIDDPPAHDPVNRRNWAALDERGERGAMRVVQPRRLPRRLAIDQAGWHLSTGLVVPPNITIMALPPKCPELNPVENVWQFLRDNWLSNRVFKSYDDLVDHCCEGWNNLVDQPWRIMSIGLRQWAHGF